LGIDTTLAAVLPGKRIE